MARHVAKARFGYIINLKSVGNSPSVGRLSDIPHALHGPAPLRTPRDSGRVGRLLHSQNGAQPPTVQSHGRACRLRRPSRRRTRPSGRPARPSRGDGQRRMGKPFADEGKSRRRGKALCPTEAGSRSRKDGTQLGSVATRIAPDRAQTTSPDFADEISRAGRAASAARPRCRSVSSRCSRARAFPGSRGGPPRPSAGAWRRSGAGRGVSHSS